MTFVLLDGNSFCYRAFYAVRDLRTSKGQPTNAVFGFVTMLERLLKELDPDGVAATFDLKGPTFRHKKYEAYKIQRPPMPDELAAQLPIIKDVVRAYRIPIYELEGYEADDVMATLAARLEKAGHDVLIATGDKDALQLVTRRVKILNPQKENFVYDAAEVKKRFGVGPERVVDVMSLMGDAVDNIPGVPGIGEKTACKLIAEYGSLEGVYANLDKISGEKLKETLKKHRDDASLSRELATIDASVPIEIRTDDLKRREPDAGALAELFGALEFRSLLKNLPKASEPNAGDRELDYRLVRDAKGFERLKAELAKHRTWAFDFETTGTDPLTAVPIGISFSWREKEAHYVQFAPPPGAASLAGPADPPSPLRPDECLGSLKGLFEDPSIRKVGQNLKYEIRILGRYGIDLAGVWFDTMVASYCLNPAKPNHNLDDIALEQLGVRITPIEELIGKGRAQIGMQEVAIDKLYRYGCQDSDVALRLARVLGGKLDAEPGVRELFDRIEMPLVKVLAGMETAGVAVDRKLLSELSAEMQRELESITTAIHELAGGPFNINSPKQLAEILFGKLGLRVVKRTKTGASTDVEVLQELSESHPLPKEILKYRELSKLKSTYVDALPLLADPGTGRVHTSFNQTVTATGRLSSSEPNLQNIPVRTAEGRKIRRAFVAGGEGMTLVSADYSQIELRILAHLSEDENLIRAFHEGADIHRYTASLICGVPMDHVTDSMRSSAKTVNFGVLYGMGAFSLAKGLRLSVEAAKDFIKSYFDRYPKVKGYLDGTMEKARRDGYVETLFKRRRYIPDIVSKDPRARSFAERTAINAPIQGTASDVIKIAMLRIDERLRADGYRSRMVLQVHDELLFETPRRELDRLVGMVRAQMQGAVELKVPLSVSIAAGPNWLDTEDRDET